jgi:hypothetical protein
MKLTILIISLALLQAAEALAWEQGTCIMPLNKGMKKHWATKEYRPVIDPVSIPEGSPQHVELLKAIALMNQNPSQFSYAVAGFDNDDGVATDNGESEIWLADLGEKYAGVSAVEQSNAEYSTTCTATESDIIINTRYRPTREPVGVGKIGFSQDKNQLFEYGGSYSHFRAVLMHELGHSAGLQHEGDVLNLMGGNNLLVANGDFVQAYIGADAAAGLVAIYGLAANAKPDLSVNHWRYGGKIAGVDGSFYSHHYRTRIFDTRNQELPKTCGYSQPDLNGPLLNACPEPIYRANPGATIKLELSYEIAGAANLHSVKAHYYLSTDNFIDAKDTLLKTRTLTLKENGKPLTTTTNLVLPKTLERDTDYWLGCIVDAEDRVEESVETNNATYLGIKVNSK